jgi:hypothetical protein
MGWPVFRPFPDDFPTSARGRDTPKSDYRVALSQQSYKFVHPKAASLAIRGDFPIFGEHPAARIDLASNGGIMPDRSNRSMTSE